MKNQPIKDLKDQLLREPWESNRQISSGSQYDDIRWIRISFRSDFDPNLPRYNYPLGFRIVRNRK